MYLLDTHTLLWLLFRKDNLSFKAKLIINNADSLHCSIASLWEIAIKQSLGKLEFDEDINEIYRKCIKKNIDFVGIDPDYCEEIKNLPLKHSDPFDRMIIAQAIINKFKVISKDKMFEKYPIEVVW